MPKAKNSRKLPYTPNSVIRSAMRQMWLRCRERAAAVKEQHNTCQVCGKKGSVAKGREVKIEVHHISGVDWEGLFDDIRKRLLQTPKDYRCLCTECHGKIHTEEKEANNE